MLDEPEPPLTLLYKGLNRFVLRAAILTSIQAILVSVFALVFRKVELPGDWNKASRYTLGDALPVLYLISNIDSGE